MKKLLLLCFVLIGIAPSAFSQRFVYVDTEYILDQMPEYKTAYEQLDELTLTWNTELSQQKVALDQLKSEYKANELLLTESQKVKKEGEIRNAEKTYYSLKDRRFGIKGDLYKKQKDLIQPIQDKVYAAIKKMAEQRDYDFVLDKSKGVSMLYAKSKFDMSDEVLRIVKNLN